MNAKISFLIRPPNLTFGDAHVSLSSPPFVALSSNCHGLLSRWDGVERLALRWTGTEKLAFKPTPGLGCRTDGLLI
jgi:hypothetical protein